MCDSCGLRVLGSDDVIAKVVQSPAISLKLTGMEGMPTAKAKSMEPQAKPRPKAKPKAKVMPRVKAKVMPKALKARVNNQRLISNLGAAQERLRTALGSQTDSDAEKEEEAFRIRVFERAAAEIH